MSVASDPQRWRRAPLRWSYRLKVPLPGENLRSEDIEEIKMDIGEAQGLLHAFGALYVAFLGRTNGPRAGWLLASLDAAFVIGRLREAAGWDTGGDGVPGPGGEA